jgi:hypothetical protein
MAKLFVVVVRDRALDIFGRPFFAPSLAMAERSFKDEVNSAESPMHNHPEDFDSYILGTYDEATATFECAAPVVFLRAQDVKRTVS